MQFAIFSMKKVVILQFKKEKSYKTKSKYGRQIIHI